MDPLIPISVTLVVVVTFAFVTSALVHRYLHGRAALSGVEYLLVGVLVGYYGVDLLSPDVIVHLRPFLFLALGLAGFSLGLRVRPRLDQASGFLGGMVSAVLVAVLVGAAVFGLLSTESAPDWLFGSRLWIGLLVGAAAAATSSIGVEMAIARSSARGPATETLRGFALAGTLTAVIIAGGALAERRAWSESNQMGMTPAEWLIAVLSLGLVVGLLYRIFIGPRPQDDEDRTFLALVGTITFTSGIAAAVGVSPLLTCAVAGATVSLVSRAAEQLEHSMERLERPALAVLTIFAGAMWVPLDGVLWLLPLAYLVIRVFALALATRIGLASQPGLPPIAGMSSAMITQGGVVAALLIDFALVYPIEGEVVLTTVLTPLLLFDFLGTAYLTRFFARAGEAGRATLDAEQSGDTSEADDTDNPTADASSAPDTPGVPQQAAEAGAKAGH